VDWIHLTNVGDQQRTDRKPVILTLSFRGFVSHTCRRPERYLLGGHTRLTPGH